MTCLSEPDSVFLALIWKISRDEMIYLDRCVMSVDSQVVRVRKEMEDVFRKELG